MKLAFAVLSASALSAIALVSVAIAQPPSNGPGGFALLQHDANGDGRVTKAEFDAAQKSRFDDVDANKDGAASSEEFRAKREVQAEGMRIKLTSERFDRLDADKSGQISRAEFSAGPSGTGGPDKMRAGPPGGRGPGRGGMGPAGVGLAARTDGNADGTVTLSEFSARGTEAFNRADANKDGVVTVLELQSLMPPRP